MQRHVFSGAPRGRPWHRFGEAEPLSLTPRPLRPIQRPARLRRPMSRRSAQPAPVAAERAPARIRRRQFRRQSRRRLHRVPVQRRPRGGAAASAVRRIARGEPRPSRRQSPSTRVPIDPKFFKQVVRLRRLASRPAPSSSTRRSASCSWCRTTARRCATASASASRASPGPARRRSRPRRNGRIGRRRRRCWSAGPTCRTSWPAARRIRWARARCISAPRSIASTAPTSPGPSAGGVVRLHPHAQRGRHRPLRAGQGRHQGGGDLTPLGAANEKAAVTGGLFFAQSRSLTRCRCVVAEIAGAVDVVVAALIV